MSRNLCRTSCYFCKGEVKLTEEPRKGTEVDFGGYKDQYDGMIIANAECSDCEAKYLAWIDERTRCSQEYHGCNRYTVVKGKFIDLSFRSSFNDEPDVDDLPRWKFVTTRQRVEPDRHEKCGTVVMNQYCIKCHETVQND